MMNNDDDLALRGMHYGRNYIEEVKQLKLDIDRLKSIILKLEREKQFHAKKVG